MGRFFSPHFCANSTAKTMTYPAREHKDIFLYYRNAVKQKKRYVKNIYKVSKKNLPTKGVGRLGIVKGDRGCKKGAPRLLDDAPMLCHRVGGSAVAGGYSVIA